MQANSLSGIERELVLRYLLDGNVPVTITPENEKSETDEIKSKECAVVPVLFKAENISVLKEGIILLNDLPDAMLKYVDSLVRVEFYFNSAGLYFISTLKSIKSGYALVIPEKIHRVPDFYAEKKYDFTALLVLSVSEKGASKFPCVPCESVELFVHPKWSSIKLENQQRAKKLLEEYVQNVKDKHSAGNGLRLINICQYMVLPKIERVEAVQGRVKPFEILFVDHERIILGFEKNEAFELSEDSEYPLEMSFALKDTTSIVRKIFVTCKVTNLFKNEDGTKFAADCIYTMLQEEDCRFLYEKATSTLFV